MSPASRSVTVAIAANGSLAAAKLAAFFVTGSASMLSEGLHSLADLANQSLLAVGLRRSRAPADREHPYGYGRERYVFALLAASGVFFMGAGATLYNGVVSLLDPGELQRLDLAVVILAAALLAEGASFFVALRAVRKTGKRSGLSLRQTLRDEADPVVVGVLAEDGAALFGVLLAAIGVGLSHHTGDPTWDALGGIAVAIVMGVSAVFLIDRNRRLLVGLTANEEREAVLAALRASPVVRHVRDAKVTVLDADTVRFKAEIDFDGAELARRYLADHDPTEVLRRVTGDDELRAFLTAYTEHVVERLGDEIDRIEEDIQRERPRVRHIDLEVD